MNQRSETTYVDASNISFVYQGDEDAVRSIEALDDVSLHIPQGSHVAILGRNGSGKSTLAKLINALELPGSGVMVVAGYDTRDEAYLWEIRRRTGMVFQNPDNQIVGTTVEEDAAFGPENLGVPLPELRERVHASLAEVGLLEQAKRQPADLSGGQKQKLAIAGILAMQPECIILDEATAMLDPRSRHEFLELIHALRRERGLTVINVTHHMDEALQADYLYVLNQGTLVLEGKPSEVFQQADTVQALGLEVPTPTAVAAALATAFEHELPVGAADHAAGAAEAIVQLLDRGPARPEALEATNATATTATHDASNANSDTIIQVRDLHYSYNKGESREVRALRGINFSVRKGEVLGIIGSSGSGKSTLIQHLNALLRPQQGSVEIAGYSVGQKDHLKPIRDTVGLLFQYPEHQLFAESIYEDVAFGPRQAGVDPDTIHARVRDALEVVGMGQEDWDRSPFELSGGQMRRVALAGILSMNPSILILDEPAAGLDPVGREEILSYILTLRERGVTVVLVSHSMDDVARFADRLLVLHEGEQLAWGPKEDVFAQEQILYDVNLELPQVTRFMQTLATGPVPELQEAPTAYTVRDACRQLIGVWHTRRGTES